MVFFSKMSLIMFSLKVSQVGTTGLDQESSRWEAAESKDVNGLVAPSSSTTGALQPPKQREGGRSCISTCHTRQATPAALWSSGVKLKSPLQVHLVSFELLGILEENSRFGIHFNSFR